MSEISDNQIFSSEEEKNLILHKMIKKNNFDDDIILVKKGSYQIKFDQIDNNNYFTFSSKDKIYKTLCSYYGSRFLFYLVLDNKNKKYLIGFKCKDIKNKRIILPKYSKIPSFPSKEINKFLEFKNLVDNLNDNIFCNIYLVYDTYEEYLILLDEFSNDRPKSGWISNFTTNKLDRKIKELIDIIYITHNSIVLTEGLKQGNEIREICGKNRKYNIYLPNFKMNTRARNIFQHDICEILFSDKIILRGLNDSVDNMESYIHDLINNFIEKFKIYLNEVSKNKIIKIIKTDLKKDCLSKQLYKFIINLMQSIGIRG